MADYYPLIARAVGGLDKNTGEIRRALYERARSALVNHLRSVDPPLNESDITRERLALEEAIRNVEAEAAKRSRSDATDGAEDSPPSRDDFSGYREMVAEGLGGAAADEPPVFGAGDPVFEPPAANEPIRPARSYGRLIKIVLLLLIVAGVAGAAYWQRNTLTSLVASFRTDSETDIWDLAIPIFAFGVIAFIFAYVFSRRWFGNRS
jgi:hypothetical protein